MKTFYIKNFTLILLTALLVSFCVVQKSPVTGSKRAYGYSWEEEKKLGKQADQQIQQQYGVYQGEEVVEYVKNVGQEVLAVSHMRREDTQEKYRETEFHFRVLDSPVTNAFALPGGYVYVTRGMLAHLKNEAQLAVVLGHEIGHVAARHSSQRAFEQQVGQLALIGGAVAGQELLGVPGGTILNLGSQAAQFLFLSYSRDDERESDKLGVEYAAMQNYEAADGAGFFSALERISEQAGQSLPTWASTHPDPGERAERIPELAQNWAEKGYKQTVEDTDQFMNTIDGMIYGMNPRQGFSSDGHFYHPELEFQFSYPSGWSVVNQATMVAVVNEAQDAVSIMQIDSQSESPQASVSQFVNQQGFTVQAQGEQNDGLNGYEAIATAQSQKGATYQYYVYAVDYGGNIYRFTSYTTSENFNKYAPQFEDISLSFAELSDENILDIQPIELQTLKADRTAQFSNFLSGNFPIVPDDYPVKITREDIAILNQVQMDETIEEGTWIKIPKH